MDFDPDGTGLSITLSIRPNTRINVSELTERARLCVSFEDNASVLVFADPEPLRAFAESLLEQVDRLDRERVTRERLVRKTLGLELEPQT